jgi:probable rRNA maturation factor
MPFEIVPESDAWSAVTLEPLVKQAYLGVMSHLGFDPDLFELAVLACDDTRIMELNGSFRDKARPTNVLSWPAWDLSAETEGDRPGDPEPGTPEMPESLGDIAISFDTCCREALDAGKKIEDHVTHLTVHGVLHLLGYDHIRDQDATLMEGIETTILGKLGVDDPYLLIDRAERSVFG